MIIVKETLWTIMRILTVAIELPFMALKVVADTVESAITALKEWEDRNFGWKY